MRGLACQERESHDGAGARTADTMSARTVVEGGGRCVPACPRAASARTARRRRPAGCRQPKIGPPEQKSRQKRRPRLLIANGYLPGVTVGGIRVRCSAAAPACGSARSRCQPICGVARSLWRGLRPSVVANRGLAILAESSEPATTTPRATRLMPMMKFLIIVVFYFVRSTRSSISRPRPGTGSNFIGTRR
jgi:hypothetical protein